MTARLVYELASVLDDAVRAGVEKEVLYPMAKQLLRETKSLCDELIPEGSQLERSR